MQKTVDIQGLTCQLNWPQTAEQEKARVVDFWRRERAFSESEIYSRADELLAVVSEGTEIVAVSTVRIERLEQIEKPVFCYRTYSTEHVRQRKLSGYLIIEAFNFLEACNRDTQEAVGMYYELEYQPMLNVRNIPFTPARFIHLGYHKAGWQRRLKYFDHATL